MTVQAYPLDRIAPNPFQTRLAEDPAQVARVAQSIHDVGLLQKPVGRVMVPSQDGDAGSVQLAFGHTRLAAFRQLAQEDPEAWAVMDVEVRGLTDEQMFELAVRENLDRKDLTPVEEARAMARYRDDFHKTSGEIGALFGCSDSAVRNKLRLLDLPESVQERLQAGEIHEGAARRLLSLVRIAPESIDKLAKELVEGEVESSEAVVERVTDVLMQHAFHMGENRYGYRHFDQGEDEEAATKGRAGAGLWPYSWKGSVTPPTARALAQLLEGRGWKRTPEELEPVMAAFLAGTDVDGVVALFGLPRDEAAWMRQFVAPPPCSACEFHQVLDGSHYCGIKACWEQKRKAWIVVETARVARKLGLPVYNPAEDGKAWIPAPTRWREGDSRQLEPAWAKMLKAKDESLRVRGHSPDYQPHAGTRSFVAELVRVGKPAEQAKAAEKRRNRQGGYGQSFDYAAEQRKAEAQRKRREAAESFLERDGAPVFGPMLKGLDKVGVLEALVAVVAGRWDNSWKRGIPTKPAARCAALREILALKVLDHFCGRQVLEKGPLATSKHVAGLAKSLGVRLPSDWTERAQALEPKAASVSGKQDDEEE